MKARITNEICSPQSLCCDLYIISTLIILTRGNITQAISSKPDAFLLWMCIAITEVNAIQILIRCQRVNALQIHMNSH